MKALVIVLIVVAALVGAFLYMAQDLKKEQSAEIKQICVEKYQSLPDKGIISDIEGYCGCTADIKRPAKAAEIKAGARACMDRYGKQNLLKKCESMNDDLRGKSSDVKGVNCECFYDKLVSFFGEQVAGQSSADKITKEQRNETIGRAFMACKSQ